MLNGFSKVNLLTEFNDIKNIELLDEYFKKNKWSLIKKIDRKSKQPYYQVYFGKNVQVDNNLEYGFAYAYDKFETKAELKRLTNFVIKYKYVDYSKSKSTRNQER